MAAVDARVKAIDLEEKALAQVLKTAKTTTAMIELFNDVDLKSPEEVKALDRNTANSLLKMATSFPSKGAKHRGMSLLVSPL
jgi:hypothetical protein